MTPSILAPARRVVGGLAGVTVVALAPTAGCGDLFESVPDLTFVATEGSAGDAADDARGDSGCAGPVADGSVCCGVVTCSCNTPPCGSVCAANCSACELACAPDQICCSKSHGGISCNRGAGCQ